MGVTIEVKYWRHENYDLRRIAKRILIQNTPRWLRKMKVNLLVNCASTCDPFAYPSVTNLQNEDIMWNSLQVRIFPFLCRLILRNVHKHTVTLKVNCVLMTGIQYWLFKAPILMYNIFVLFLILWVLWVLLDLCSYYVLHSQAMFEIFFIL